jgi:predicted negative regulator of RcsB-dependent stress response
MRARALVASDRSSDAGDYLEQAQKHLSHAAELTGGDPVISEHLGDVYLLLDDKSEALRLYEEAMVLKPRRDEQPDLLRKLEDLRKELGEQ